MQQEGRRVRVAGAGKPVRRLWGKGKGKFRTKGRYASATIRGTWWLTADFCKYTLVRVNEGSVTVQNLVSKKFQVIKAPKSFGGVPEGLEPVRTSAQSSSRRASSRWWAQHRRRASPPRPLQVRAMSSHSSSRTTRRRFPTRVIA